MRKREIVMNCDQCMKEEIKARVTDRQPCSLLRNCSYAEARRRGNSPMRAKGREWGGGPDKQGSRTKGTWPG